MNKDKKYLKPEADIVEFHTEDIIVTSNEWWDGGNDVGGGSGGDVPQN